MTGTTAAAHPHPTDVLGALARTWPVALGLLGAAFSLLTGADRTGLAVTVVIAQSCYVAAAACGRPVMAWVWILPASLLVVVSRVLGLDPVLTVGLAGLALVPVGLLRAAYRPWLVRQTVALVGYGGVVAVAMLAGPGPGLALAAAALIGHGVWDAWLLRRHRDEDVPTSLLVACVSLDVPLGIAALVVAFLL